MMIDRRGCLVSQRIRRVELLERFLVDSHSLLLRRALHLGIDSKIQVRLRISAEAY